MQSLMIPWMTGKVRHSQATKIVLIRNLSSRIMREIGLVIKNKRNIVISLIREGKKKSIREVLMTAKETARKCEKLKNLIGNEKQQVDFTNMEFGIYR